MSRHFFESFGSTKIRLIGRGHLSATAVSLSPLRQASKTWHRCYTSQQNGIGQLDAGSKRSLNSTSSGVLIVLVSQEGIRCAKPFRRRGKSGAAPATVGGEPFSKIPLGFAVQSLGRRRGARTREPGDLPERSHSFRRAGRACGADFRCGDKTALSRAGRAAKAPAAMSAPAASMSAPATKRNGACGRHCYAEDDSRCGRNQFPPHRSLSLFPDQAAQRCAGRGPISIYDCMPALRANKLQIAHEENSLRQAKKCGTASHSN